MRLLSAVVVVGAVLTPTAGLAQDRPGAAAALPVGACLATRITDVGPRLQGAEDSGSSVAYASGDFGSSYDEVAALKRATVGDPVKVCVVSTEHRCPRDTPPSQLLAARDLRSGATWRLYTTEHSCRGQ